MITNILLTFMILIMTFQHMQNFIAFLVWDHLTLWKILSTISL